MNEKPNFIFRALDLVEGMMVAIAIVFIQPIMIARLFGRGSQIVQRVVELSRVGLFSSYMRAVADQLVGHPDRALAALEGIIATVEEQASQPLSRSIRIALHELYVQMIQLYFIHGYVDDAAAATIRACKFLNVERLPGLASFDVRTAQVVKAAMAAGRLLPEGSSATLLVRSGKDEASTTRKPRLHPVSKGLQNGEGSEKKETGGKVIPFPTPHELEP
jgi:hypothetical protein